MIEKFYKKLINVIYEQNGTFLKFGTENFSYKDFRNILESFLWQFSKFNQQPIVIISDKCPEMYAAIIAILLTNNIWVPLSPKMGEKRLFNIIKRLKPKYIIDNNECNLEYSDVENEEVYNISTFTDLLTDSRKMSPQSLKFDYSSLDTSMIYFTSGSTGNPKGVLITHQSYITNVNDMLRIINYGSNKVFADIHDTSFVISIPVILPCVFLGGTLSIPSNPLEAIYPLDLINRHKISCLITVPSVIDRIKLSQLENLENMNLECLIVCGEPCHISTMKFILENIKPNNVYNFYGSTEVGPWIFYAEIRDTDMFDKNSSYIPIGIPINEDEISIEEDGELIVTGPKVTKGYFGDTDKEKFFTRSNKVWFKTGDIVEKKGKWFTCLGRKDSQVKISGYRIDLMEIEGNIQLIDGVEGAVCIVKENQVGKFIASVVISKKSISNKIILRFLTDRIPNYMLPKEFYLLKEKPINKNGKLDRSFIKKKFGAIN